MSNNIVEHEYYSSERFILDCQLQNMQVYHTRNESMLHAYTSNGDYAGSFSTNLSEGFLLIEPEQEHYTKRVLH
jgi:hypothetical protein